MKSNEKGKTWYTCVSTFKRSWYWTNGFFAIYDFILPFGII